MAEQQVFPTKGNLIASKKALKLAGLEAKQLDADTCFLEGIIPLAQSLL